MFFKGKKLLKNIVSSVDSVKLKGLPKAIILAYVGQLFLLVTIYIIALAADFMIHTKFDYQNALALLKTLISGETVLALGIICKGVYDKDNDGVPDIAENDEKQDDTSQKFKGGE